MIFRFYDLRHIPGEFLGYEYAKNVEEVKMRYNVEVSVCGGKKSGKPYAVFSKYETRLYLKKEDGSVYFWNITDDVRQIWPIRQKITKQFIDKVSKELEKYEFLVQNGVITNLMAILVDVSKKVH